MEQTLRLKQNLVSGSNWYYICPNWLNYYLNHNEFSLMCMFLANTQQLTAKNGAIIINDKAYLKTHMAIYAELEMSPSAIKRSQTNLEKMGLITTTKTAKGNSYIVNYDLIRQVTYKLAHINIELWRKLRCENGERNLKDVIETISL